MSEFSVRRPVTIFMICLGLVVLGFISASRIQLQLFPDVTTPEFSIQTYFKGATPEEVERLITIPLERTISIVAGLYRTESYSETGRSDIRLKFSSSIDYLETLSLLRDKVEEASLPESASRPRIVRFSANTQPVLRLAIKRKGDKLSILELAKFVKDDLVRKLESQDGVAMALLMGAPNEVVNIEVDPIASSSFDINLKEIPSKIKGSNKSHPGGSIQHLGKNTSIRLGQSIQSLKGLGDVVVKKDKEKIVRLKDISIIKKELRGPIVRSHLDGEESLILEIKKEALGNTVEVGEKSKHIIKKFLLENSDEIEGTILYDQSTEIKLSIDSVIDAVISGGVLASIVIFLFLQSYGPTAIIAFSIPMSLMITLILMYFTGVTFNIMSLGGLALGVGMLVDNSIVVLENINRFKLKMDDAAEAAIWGTKKVSAAITVSTLTTIAVFVPLIFVEGMIGQLFKDISLTVVYSLVSSLFVAIMVIPMLSSFKFVSNNAKVEKSNSLLAFLVKLKNDASIEGHILLRPLFLVKRYAILSFAIFKIFLLKVFVIVFNVLKFLIITPIKIFDFNVTPVFGIVSNGIQIIQKIYSTKIETYMNSKGKTLAFVLILFSSSILLFISRGAELFPKEASNRIQYQLEFPVGQTLDLSESKVFKIENDLKKIDGLLNIASLTGVNGAHNASLLLIIDPIKSTSVSYAISEVLSKVPELIFSQKSEAMLGGGKEIEVELYSRDLKELKSLSKEVLTELKSISGLVNLETDLKADVEQIDIEFIRQKLDKLKVGSDAFIGAMKAIIMGQESGVLQLEGQEFATRITVAPSYLNSLDKIKYFSIPSKLKRIYLNQVSRIKNEKVVGVIKRVNRKRMMSVSADLEDIDLQFASRIIQERLSIKFKDRDIKWSIGGADQQRKESEKSLIIAVLMSLFLIYILLAAQFESFRQPMIILFAVPLCIVGVSFLLFALNMNISALVFVGFIILAGISVNTSIILVETINQNMMLGMAMNEAIIQAARNRLRPILMTAMSTIIGLLPMAFAIGQGAGMRQPLAITVIGGLVSSTILTVIVVPLIYEKLSGSKVV